MLTTNSPMELSIGEFVRIGITCCCLHRWRGCPGHHSPLLQRGLRRPPRRGAQGLPRGCPQTRTPLWAPRSSWDPRRSWWSRWCRGTGRWAGRGFRRRSPWSGYSEEERPVVPRSHHGMCRRWRCCRRWCRSPEPA